MKLPAGHQRVIPYLILKDAEGFFKFTTSVFDAKETFRSYREETKVLSHCEIAIGDCAIMFAESTANWGVENAGLFVYMDDPDAAFNKAIKAGATEVMPMTDQHYGRSGGVKDPFGNTWWITGVTN
ncbi:VOC family protein [Chitinophaga sp. 212800010-3]|uniref:VOC family protein n=1 Tax=unclassified Chitinophaga TaxID=2619133 RepID=UPI002DE237AC|nr:VOC domain-containing protein [Chitinophaga sp. 212800010-3]